MTESDSSVNNDNMCHSTVKLKGKIERLEEIIAKQRDELRAAKSKINNLKEALKKQTSFSNSILVFFYRVIQHNKTNIKKSIFAASSAKNQTFFLNFLV